MTLLDDLLGDGPAEAQERTPDIAYAGAQGVEHGEARESEPHDHARADDGHGHPLETIDRRKIQGVAKAARDFVNMLHGPWPEMRFDAIGVLMGDPPEVTLVRGAFEV